MHVQEAECIPVSPQCIDRLCAAAGELDTIYLWHHAYACMEMAMHGSCEPVRTTVLLGIYMLLVYLAVCIAFAHIDIIL